MLLSDILGAIDMDDHNMVGLQPIWILNLWSRSCQKIEFLKADSYDSRRHLKARPAGDNRLFLNRILNELRVG